MNTLSQDALAKAMLARSVKVRVKNGEVQVECKPKGVELQVIYEGDRSGVEVYPTSSNVYTCQDESCGI